MPRNVFGKSYLVGVAMVWVAIDPDLAVAVAGSPAFARRFPVPGGGAVSFIGVVPAGRVQHGNRLGPP